MTRLAAWWFAPAPATRIAALRIAIGSYAFAYVVMRTPELLAVARLPAADFAPYGVTRALAAPLPPGAVLAIAVATCALLAAFTLGLAYRAVAPLAAAALLWTLSYRNAWGQLFHTEDLLVLHVIALACAPAADAWALRRPRAPAAAGYGWPVRLLVALTAATYLLAAIAKLRLAGLAWVDGAQLRDQIAVDNLRKAVLGDPVGPLAGLLLDHPGALWAASIGTLVIELGAPIALVGGRVGRLWAVAAWAFHLGVLLTMNVVFPYPLSGVALLPLFPVERVIQVAREWRRRRAG